MSHDTLPPKLRRLKIPIIYYFRVPRVKKPGMTQLGGFDFRYRVEAAVRMFGWDLPGIGGSVSNMVSSCGSWRKSLAKLASF